MQFTRRRSPDANTKLYVTVNLKREMYEAVEVISFAETCTITEAVHRLLEAGIAVYHQGKEQAAGDE